MITEIPKSLIKELRRAEKQAQKDIRQSEGKVLKGNILSRAKLCALVVTKH